MYSREDKREKSLSMAVLYRQTPVAARLLVVGVVSLAIVLAGLLIWRCCRPSRVKYMSVGPEKFPTAPISINIPVTPTTNQDASHAAHAKITEFLNMYLK